MAKINITLFDNLNIDFYDYKEAYMENESLTEEDEVRDSDVWEFINEMLSIDWDDFKDNLRWSEYKDDYCVITGRLGLWNGRPRIEPKTCSNLLDAICKCVDGCDYCKIKQVNGHLEVNGYHHDGCNCFEIHLLNDSGVRAMERINEGWGTANLADRHYHKAFRHYVF